MVEQSDALLIEASLKEPARFGDLFDRHAAEIRGYLHRRVGDATGNDLTAETFAVAFKNRERYDASRHDARPWLYGIAANLIRNHRRSERRQAKAYARLAPDPDPSLDPPAIHERVDAAASRTGIYAAIASLRREDRELVLLHAWADLSHREIAEALGLPIGTVKSRLSRSLEKLRTALELPAPDQGESEGPDEADETRGSD